VAAKAAKNSSPRYRPGQLLHIPENLNKCNIIIHFIHCFWQFAEHKILPEDQVFGLIPEGPEAACVSSGPCHGPPVAVAPARAAFRT
jgi:hypothetical protein